MNSRSEILNTKLLFYILNILHSADSPVSGAYISERIDGNLSFNEWENEINIQTAETRWKRNVNFTLMHGRKLGLINRNSEGFYITDSGRTAFHLGGDEIKRIYRKGRDDKKNITRDFRKKNVSEVDEIKRSSYENFKSHINRMNDQEFQEFSTLVLKSCGYFIQSESERKRDGGIDIIASEDQTGNKFPLLKVQVKHWKKNKAGIDLVRQLSGVVNYPYSTGMFISSGGFTDDAVYETNITHEKVSLINLEKLYNLWISNYSKLPENEHIIKVKNISYVIDA